MENKPFLTDPAGRCFSLSRAVTTLGRSPKSDVCIPDPRASRHHAEIRCDGESCALCDLDSTNGTFVNGRRLTAPQTLTDGDEITIGGVVLTFHDPEATFRSAQFPLLVVDSTSGEVWVNRKAVSLSAKEQALFDFLYRRGGRVCSKQEIAEAVWPEYQAEVYDYQIESLVKRLREKLEPNPHSPILILTLAGHGYKLVR